MSFGQELENIRNKEVIYVTQKFKKILLEKLTLSARKCSRYAYIYFVNADLYELDIYDLYRDFDDTEDYIDNFNWFNELKNNLESEKSCLISSKDVCMWIIEHQTDKDFSCIIKEGDDKITCTWLKPTEVPGIETTSGNYLEKIFQKEKTKLIKKALRYVNGLLRDEMKSSSKSCMRNVIKKLKNDLETDENSCHLSEWLLNKINNTHNDTLLIKLAKTIHNLNKL
jgi:hypothetical protein